MNVTNILVLATLFISVSQEYNILKLNFHQWYQKGIIFRLPKTSYVKLVDYWLLFTLAIPLVEVLLHTMIANYNMKIENEKACKGIFLKHFGHTNIYI